MYKGNKLKLEFDSNNFLSLYKKDKDESCRSFLEKMVDLNFSPPVSQELLSK